MTPMLMLVFILCLAIALKFDDKPVFRHAPEEPEIWRTISLMSTAFQAGAFFQTSSDSLDLFAFVSGGSSCMFLGVVLVETFVALVHEREFRLPAHDFVDFLTISRVAVHFFRTLIQHHPSILSFAIVGILAQTRFWAFSPQTSSVQEAFKQFRTWTHEREVRANAPPTEAPLESSVAQFIIKLLQSIASSASSLQSHHLPEVSQAPELGLIAGVDVDLPHIRTPNILENETNQDGSPDKPSSSPTSFALSVVDSAANSSFCTYHGAMVKGLNLRDEDTTLKTKERDSSGASLELDDFIFEDDQKLECIPCESMSTSEDGMDKNEKKAMEIKPLPMALDSEEGLNKMMLELFEDILFDDPEEMLDSNIFVEEMSSEPEPTIKKRNALKYINQEDKENQKPTQSNQRAVIRPPKKQMSRPARKLKKKSKTTLRTVLKQVQHKSISLDDDFDQPLFNDEEAAALYLGW